MRWPPFRHVVFDCDSTLSAIEGIDALASRTGAAGRVEALTNAAMDGQVPLQDVYGERLQAASPTRADVLALREVYKRNAVEDAAAVIATLRELGHEVYVISGGLEEPVRQFAVWLGVPATHVRAVGVRYDQLAGQWWLRQADRPAERYLSYEQGALALSDGKAGVLASLVGEEPGARLLLGDGISDLLAARAVDLFVGYGGVVGRERVRAESPVFLTARSLAPVLPLAAGWAARRRAGGEHTALFDKASRMLDAGYVKFRESRLEEKFRGARDADRSR